jgi:hypothetical protein
VLSDCAGQGTRQASLRDGLREGIRMDVILIFFFCFALFLVQIVLFVSHIQVCDPKKAMCVPGQGGVPKGNFVDLFFFFLIY